MNNWWKSPVLQGPENDYGEYDCLIEELPQDYGEWVRHSKCDCCGKERLFVMRYVHHFYCYDGWDSMDSHECWNCMIEDKIWSIKHKIKMKIETIKLASELYTTGKRPFKEYYKLAKKIVK